MSANIAAPNADQIAYWNSAVADRWARRQAEIDAMMAPFTDALLGAANLGPDGPWRILDVGCGSGETTLMAAQIGHELTGLDVSTSLLELAKSRAEKAGMTGVNFFLGDASRLFIDPPFDLIMSRFGVMFFDDPPKAFKNLAGMTNHGGRIVFVCWRSPNENQWVTLPMSALEGMVEAGGAKQAEGPGPFAFANPDKVRTLLTGAGFTQIKITPFDGEMTMVGRARHCGASQRETTRGSRPLGSNNRALHARQCAGLARQRLGCRGCAWVRETNGPCYEVRFKAKNLGGNLRCKSLNHRPARTDKHLVLVLFEICQNLFQCANPARSANNTKMQAEV
jgi:SAM-dependent methyltransferase